jgi:hypothetical protein
VYELLQKAHAESATKNTKGSAEVHNVNSGSGKRGEKKR